MSEEKACILIDDDEDDHSFFSTALGRLSQKINCMHFLDPNKALETILQNRGAGTCCIFIDLNMAQLNGLECLRIIKGTSILSNIPVVIYSTSSNPKDIDASKILGAAAYMVKSNSIAELVGGLSGFFIGTGICWCN